MQAGVDAAGAGGAEIDRLVVGARGLELELPVRQNLVLREQRDAVLFLLGAR
ncbi:hypothetical protein LP420_14630 [Massilia sp. B-10]|nr:hypothetical protein LP420_14630 [Massilia sp. B-10]